MSNRRFIKPKTRKNAQHLKAGLNIVQALPRDAKGKIPTEALQEFFQTQRFTNFMVNTLAHATFQWMDMMSPDLLDSGYKFKMGVAKNALNNFILEGRKQPDLEEMLCESSEEFLAIMKLIMRQKSVVERETLLSFCEVMASDDIKMIEEFWQGLGMIISQSKITGKVLL